MEALLADSRVAVYCVAVLFDTNVEGVKRLN